jgi:hypothetical protein
MKKIISISVLLIALTACSSNPTLTDRAALQAHSSADVSKRLSDAERKIERGREAVKKGERLVERGQDQINRGQSDKAAAIRDYCKLAPVDPVC